MLKNRKAHKISCLSCFVAPLCLGRNIDIETLTELDRSIVNILEIKKGAHAFLINDPLTAIYGVYMGSCKQYYLDDSGVERIENFYLPGDLIGLESIPNGIHRYSLMALEDSQLCIIQLSDLISQMQKSASVTKRILDICSYKMQNDKQVATATNASQRIADLLLNIYYRLEERLLNKNALILPMSQLDISNFLGMAHETVNRILRKLHQEKIISIENKKINIFDLERLKALGSKTQYTGQSQEKSIF